MAPSFFFFLSRAREKGSGEETTTSDMNCHTFERSVGMAWFHVTLSLRDAPSSSVESSSVSLAIGEVISSLRSSPADPMTPRYAPFFQDHDSDLLCVQPADPESSGWADMAGWQRLGRPRAGASGGIHSEATTGYARTRIRAVTQHFSRAREHIMEIRCFSRAKVPRIYSRGNCNAAPLRSDSPRGDVKARSLIDNPNVFSFLVLYK